MKEDISRLSLIATLLVSAILLFTYRSPRILVLALVPVAGGALAGIAAVSLGFGFVHGITLGFGVTLMGESVDYSIYLFAQTAPGTSPDATLPRIWPTLQLGVLVSICGFSAMLFSSFTGFVQLGLFSITGLLVAVAVTRWVLPALLARNFATARSAIFAPALLAAVAHARMLRLPALLVLAGSIAVLLLHRGGFWEDDLTTLSPIPASDQKLDQTLRADIGAPDVRYIVVGAAPDEQRALLMSERIATVMDGLVGQGILAGYDAPTRYLPSAATQQARLDALPPADELRARLDQALQDMPFQSDLFAPFLANVAAAKAQPLLDRSALQGTSLALKFRFPPFRGPRRMDGPAVVARRDRYCPVGDRYCRGRDTRRMTSSIDLKKRSRTGLLEVYRRESADADAHRQRRHRGTARRKPALAAACGAGESLPSPAR